MDIAWIFIFLVLYALIQVNIHESSHALVATLLGVPIDEYKPYPHKKGDMFYFGRVSYADDFPFHTLDWKMSLSHLAPVAFNILFTVALLIVCATTDLTPWVRGLVLAIMYNNLIDGLNNERQGLFSANLLEKNCEWIFGERGRWIGSKYDILKWGVRTGKNPWQIRFHAIGVTTFLVVSCTLATVIQFV